VRAILYILFFALITNIALASSKTLQCDALQKNMQRHLDVANGFADLKELLRPTAPKNEKDYKKFKNYEVLETKNIGLSADYAAIFSAVCK
jgi:hypothetical protein